MAVAINGNNYYRTCGISPGGCDRAVLFRWLKAEYAKDILNPHGWRMFTQNDLNSIRTEAKMINIEYNPNKSDS